MPGPPEERHLAPTSSLPFTSKSRFLFKTSLLRGSLSLKGLLATYKIYFPSVPQRSVFSQCPSSFVTQIHGLS